jgi:hypothetical protein
MHAMNTHRVDDDFEAGIAELIAQFAAVRMTPDNPNNTNNTNNPNQN